MGVSLVSPEDQTASSGSGASDTKEATQLLIKTAVESVSTALKATGSESILGDIGLPMLVKRRDTDTSVSSDSQYMTLNCDEEGRLKVATKPASYTEVTGNIISSTSTVFIDCLRFSNLMIRCKGTFSAVNCAFEGSLDSTNGTDGTWFTVQAIRSNANTIETSTGSLSAAPAYAWELSVNAFKYFRVRATAWTSGTQIWTFIPGTYATEPIPGAQVSGTQPVSGTVTANEGTPVTPSANITNSTASTNGTVVKASAGTIYGVVLSNNGATDAWFKLHNSTTITVGTTAVSMWIKIPSGSNVNMQWGSKGLRHGTGICFSITGAVADTDTTAIAAGQVKVNLSYV